MKDIRAITVCIDFADLLDISLAYNSHRFQRRTVVTHPRDDETIRVVREHGADLVLTEAFYDRGADFNKYAALEYGLDLMGREGWIAVVDVDILFPKYMPDWTKEKGCLYVPRRRMFPVIPAQVEDVPPDWGKYRYPMVNEEFAGYCQIFHADDPVLGPAPWYETNWTWAAGPDSVFHEKWPEDRKVRPPFEVLHLGPAFTNWAGRITPMADGSAPLGAGQRSARRLQILAGRQRLSREGEDVFSGEKLG